jgi:hypothetical protein
MRFYTLPECEEWVTGRKRPKPGVSNDTPSLRLKYPSTPHRVYVWAKWIAASLTYENSCLLWITEWGIWSSSENPHLCYRLRQSYGDVRLLNEAPGHLFLGHETTDLASFLQVAMLNGGGGYVIPATDYVHAVFSHDEHIDFYSKDEALIDRIRDALMHSKVV